MTTPRAPYVHNDVSEDIEDEFLPSSPEDSTTSSSVGDEYEESDAEREWRESLQQLELLLTMVLVPYLGKYFGRRSAYWAWGRFMEWKYPVTVEITHKKTFRITGAIEAAAAL